MAVKKEHLDKLIEDVLVWGIADYIDASAISDFASEYTKENIRELSLAAIRRCLLQGLMIPGFVQFVPWNVSLAEAMERIEEQIDACLQDRFNFSLTFLVIDGSIYHILAAMPPRTSAENAFHIVCKRIQPAGQNHILHASSASQYIKESGMATTYDDLRCYTLNALEIGIKEGVWLPGDKRSRYWQLPPSEAYEVIRQEWEKLPERLRIGDLCWFRLTQKGEELANKIAEHYDRD